MSDLDVDQRVDLYTLQLWDRVNALRDYMETINADMGRDGVIAALHAYRGVQLDAEKILVTDADG